MIEVKGLNIEKYLNMTVRENTGPSDLYSLDPIGLGTPYVESLTSFFNRLAIKHNVN